MIRQIAPEIADDLIAETHEFTQSLVTDIVHNKIGQDYDFRVDFLLNVYREDKCNKEEKQRIYSKVKDKNVIPLYFVDSGGLQLLRIRLGILNESEEEFERSIPQLLEKQEELGDILFCLDYIPLWQRGKPITKSEIVNSCYKTLEYVNIQLELLEKKKSTSKLLPINQLTQLPPLGSIWYDIVRKELDFSNPYIAGYSLTGFIKTGNVASDTTMLYNVAWLTKVQQEIYNEIGRPELLTHILGMVSVPNEFFIYGLINGNFNHVSIDGVTYVKAYVNGYIWDFPFRNIKLNGFGKQFEETIANVYAMFSDIIERHLGWSLSRYVDLLRKFHLEKCSDKECRLAMYTMRMFFTYYQQIVAVTNHINKLEFIESKFGRLYDRIKEDPNYFIRDFGSRMNSIPLIDDMHSGYEVVNVDEVL
jgi:hypothetical protein